MDQRRRLLPRFRPRSLRSTPSAQQEGPPDTANKPAVIPPGVESLPPYSPSTDTPQTAHPSPPTDPPPAYQPSSPPLPDYSALPGLPPAPRHHLTSDTSASHPQPATTYTRAEQNRHLNDIFSRHPWRRIWGRQPKSFTDALNAAALIGHEQLLNELFGLGAYLRGNRNCALPTTTPMHEALRGPKPWLAIDFLHRHHQRGGQAEDLLESKDAIGCTPLHVAAEAGETDIVRSFIELHGVAVDPVDDIGRTPLHMAARYGRTETIDMLLVYGADPGLVSERLWDFDKLWLRDGEAEKRAELLGSYTLISKTLRGALERRKDAGELGLAGAGLESYKLLHAEQENVDPDRTSTKAAAASSSRTASQPRSLTNVMGSSSAQARAWGLESLVGDPPREFPCGRQEAEATAPIREHRARVRAANPAGGIASPEYVRWKEGLDVLYHESRAQKERNRRETEGTLDLPQD